jgi:predicted  nucleic acid-binding Zn-ribbon protein
MTFVLKTITLEEQIAETVPTDRYDADLETILNDEASGWKNNILAGDFTIYDYDVSQRRFQFKKAADELDATKSQMKKLKADIEAKKSDRKQEASVKGLRNTLGDTDARSLELMAEVTKVKKELTVWEGWQKTTVDQIRSLRNIVKQYKVTKDRDFLKRAVHCISALGDEKRRKWVL